MADAVRGARVSIQSPHKDARSLPYRKANTDTCARIRIAAAATADVRNLDIDRTLLQRDAEALASTRWASSDSRVYTHMLPAESSTWRVYPFRRQSASGRPMLLRGTLQLHAFCQLFASVLLPSAS